LIRGLDTLILRAGQNRGLQHSPVRSYEKLGGNIVFWSVMLVFVTASANTLNWKIFSGVSSALLIYLPNLLSGLFIILVGLALSGLARSAVARAAESIGVMQADLLARIAQISVVLAALVIGIERLGIHVAFITTTLIVVAGVLLGGAALAFGLGSTHFVSNIIGAHTARKHYQLGQLVQIADIEGYLLEITATSLVLETEKGRASVPAKLFHEQISHTLSEVADLSSSLMRDKFDAEGGGDESK